jgi:hypothetical protein
MSLFGNGQEANLKSCEQMVEEVLADRGAPVERCRITPSSSRGPGWAFSQGSAEVYIFLTVGANAENFIQVVSPVMRPTPETMATPRFLQHLLTLNAGELTGAAFGLREDEVVLTADRSTAGLDRGEVEEMIRRVSDYADHYDDALVDAFGGVRHADLPRPRLA